MIVKNILILFIGIKSSFGYKKSMKMQNMLQQADEENPHTSKSKETYENQKVEKFPLQFSSSEGSLLLNKVWSRYKGGK